MNSSAKVFFSLLAMSALGAVGFACTVGSGTVDDVDGGTSTSSSSSSGGGTSSGGDAGEAPGLCPGYTGPRTEDGGAGGSPVFVNEQCQTCLLTNCCAETLGCFNTKNEVSIDGGPAKVGCFDYTACVVACEEATPTDDAAIAKCIVDLCDGATFPELPAAYRTFRGCGDTKCKTECP